MNRALVGLISWLETVNEDGKSLVEFISAEYHLKNSSESLSRDLKGNH